MSYNSLLKHRCTVLSLVETQVDGSPIVAWQATSTNVRCFLDLNFIRRGKDPMWTAEAGRPQDRSGVLFLRGDQLVESGNRVLMTKGPAGTFSIEGALDEAWQPDKRHHIEIGVVEVAGQLARPGFNQDGRA